MRHRAILVLLLALSLPLGAAELPGIATTLRSLEPEGARLSDLSVEPGIRAMDGEIPSPGEFKVMFLLDWEALPGSPGRREALDRVAARAASAIFERHAEVSKLRLVLKVKKGARGEESAAKLFSLTRAAWQRRDPAAAELDPGAILALGDYVVLTGKGWTRGW